MIGIEGAWGTGKTSLLNLLRTALKEQQEARTVVLTISPGLTAVIRLWWRPYCFRSPPSLPRKKNAGGLQKNGRTSEGKKR
nr:P-loop NTPase fold protein [Serratia marcescens]